MAHYRYARTDQIVKLRRFLLRHVDTPMGAVAFIPVPAESRLPCSIMETDTAVEGHPVFHRSLIGILTIRLLLPPERGVPRLVG